MVLADVCVCLYIQYTLASYLDQSFQGRCGAAHICVPISTHTMLSSSFFFPCLCKCERCVHPPNHAKWPWQSTIRHRLRPTIDYRHQTDHPQKLHSPPLSLSTSVPQNNWLSDVRFSRHFRHNANIQKYLTLQRVITHVVTRYVVANANTHMCFHFIPCCVWMSPIEESLWVVLLYLSA